MRFLLRLAAVVLIVTQLAGFACYRKEGDDVRYAPGYGYIVVVSEGRGAPMMGYDNWYYIFDSEQAARDFLNAFPPSGLTGAEMPKTFITKVCTCDSGTGGDIARKLQAPPKADVDPINRMLDRANPPLPSGPVPQ